MSSSTPDVRPAAREERSPERAYKYYDLVTAGFVTVLLFSNLIGASKVVKIDDFQFGAAIIFFPLSYIFGDVLTEVYGYARSRRVVWAGFAAMVFASFMSWVVLSLPPAPGYRDQGALEAVFGNTPRIVAASMIAYWVGEFTNSIVMAKMKLLTEGRFLWMRALGSTVVGQAIDTIIFYPLAFLGIWSPSVVLEVMLFNYIMKIGVEVVMMPITYRVVAKLKAAEHEDYFDWDTNFTPFSVKV